MTTTLAPLVTGLSEEGLGNHSPAVKNRICNAHWADLQKTPGGPIEPNNTVDQFLTKGYTGRCRLFMGRYSPTWVLNQCGKVHVYDPQDGNEADVPTWWEADTQAAQKDFVTKFAAKYDGKISALYFANGGTIYAEPFIRGIGDSRTRANLLAAGYTADKDQASYVAGYDMLKAFKSTYLAQAFNPWQYITPSSHGQDVTVTLEMMDKFASIFPRRAIWQNNSIRYPISTMGPEYATMYAHMHEGHLTGRHIGFQCATTERIGDTKATLEWAVKQGASWVELSPGYNLHVTDADLAIIDKALRAA